MSETKQDGLSLLRKPFPPNQISKLPKPKSKDSPKGRCIECGGWHGLPAVHLDYVGHAALTDRLLDADPAWSWEPLSVDERGLPALDKDGGLWIRLTVAGVTRLGYGDAQGKSGGDAMKERIGDALRNAAMRFGAALELWHKGELHATEDEPEPAKPARRNDGGGVAAEVLGTSPELEPETRQFLDELATDVIAIFNAKGAADAFERIEIEQLEMLQKIYLSTRLPSNVRNPIKAHSHEVHAKKKATAKA